MAVSFAVRSETCGLAVCDTLDDRASVRRPRLTPRWRFSIRESWLCRQRGGWVPIYFRRSCSRGVATARIIAPIRDTQGPQVVTDALPISLFPVPDLVDIPEDIRNRILAVQEKSGFIPNVFLALAHRPDEFRAFFAYHDALMERPGNLTKAEREMIVVATSSSNQCQYCVVAHGAILRIRAKDPLISDQV